MLISSQHSILVYDSCMYRYMNIRKLDCSMLSISLPARFPSRKVKTVYK